MFGLVTKKAYTDLALDLDCERVHFKKEIEHAHELNESYKRVLKLVREENTSLKEANRKLLYEKDRMFLDLLEAQRECQELKTKISSLEARWGKEATI